MKSPILILAVLLLGALATPANPSTDPRWADALKAYSQGQREQGHRLLAALAEEQPGDLDLAAACYERILAHENLPNPKAPVLADRPWVTRATARLLALERLGAHSANTSVVQSAAAAGSQFAVARSRFLEAYETITRLRAENGHDLFWRMTELRILRSMGLPEADARIAELKQDYDPDHADPEVRADWEWIATEITSPHIPLVAQPPWARPREPLPVLVPVAPEGSPLSMLAPDDPEERWRVVTEPSPKGGIGALDRLLGYTYAAAEGVPWRGSSGLLDSNRALDLHLQSKPAAEIEALRQEQEAQFAREKQTAARTEAGILRASRRFPWSRSAQALLLKLANESLWDGRSESAWRSFQEVLLHASDPVLRDAAQTGIWTVRALTGGAAEVLAQPAAFDPAKAYPWMGRPTKGAEIRTALQAMVRPAAPAVAPSLKDVRPHLLNLPPVAPWPSSEASTGFGVDLQVAGNRVVASARNIIAAYDAAKPGAPLWTQLQNRSAAPPQNHWPGYYRGLVEDGTFFSRWGVAELPSGLAAFDLANGDPLWTVLSENPWNDRRGPRPKRSKDGKKPPPRFSVPAGDPIRADGHFFFLRWDSLHELHAKQGTNLNLVCFDPGTGQARYTTTLSDHRFAGDFRGPTTAIYGNPVTVHRGAVYTCINSGQIFRSDVRDGRIEWAHNYRQQPTTAEFLGSAPIIAGKNVICMPRDSGSIIALDQRTGFLAWENPLIRAAEALGIWQDTLLVRGVATLAGLDLATGKTRWSRTLTARTLERSQLIADSIYLGDADSLVRLDARSGEPLERRPWALQSERALTFTLSGQDLYVISDRPSDDPRQKVGQPLNPELASAAAPLKLPMQRAWSLSRPDATLALPPPGVSPGSAYVISDGLIECLDISQRGAIRWRRFLNVSAPNFFFAGDTLILREREVPHLPSARVLALDSKTGVTLWEAPVPVNHPHIFHFGTRILFHDMREKLVALDLATGQPAWQTTLVMANNQNLFWDGTRLQLFRAPATGSLEHFTLDPATGDVIAHQEVESKLPGETPTAITQLAGGTYAVRFAPTSARYFRLTTLSSSGGVGDYASAAEFNLLGSDGKRLPRDKWIATADFEPDAGDRATPRHAIDDDPKSWWHTEWKARTTPHPHYFVIDLAAAQTLTGFQYLPAKIINNNGLIADYELHVSQDNKNWGAPISKGCFSENVRIRIPDQATTAPAFYEVRRQLRSMPCIYRYDVTGKAVQVHEFGSLQRVAGPYSILSVKEKLDGPDTFVVRRADDPAYLFPFPVPHDRVGHFQFVGDFAFTNQGKFEIIDLKAKRHIVVPGDEKSLVHQAGFLCLIGPDRVLKIVNREGKQLTVAIDLTNGNITEGALQHQVEPITPNRYVQIGGGQSPLITFDRTFLSYDNSTLTAWVAAP